MFFKYDKCGSERNRSQNINNQINLKQLIWDQCFSDFFFSGGTPKMIVHTPPYGEKM
jgi:hypothetical protein